MGYCGFLVLHGASVLIVQRLGLPGLAVLAWLAFPCGVSAVVCGLAAAGRLQPAGRMTLIAGTDCVVRLGLGLLGGLLWLNAIPLVGAAGIALGILGVGLMADPK